MKHSVIVYAKRTAIGKFNGALAQTSAPRLSSTLVRDAISSLKLTDESVDEIIMGQVLTAGVGQAPARQAAIYGGLGHSVMATTVGRVCGSGLKALMLADQAIRVGDAKVVLAGGQENMSLAPHLLPQSRQGYRFGSFEVKDSMQHDGLWDPYDQVAMGNCGEICAKEYQFSRESQDEFALESYKRARRASESGDFDREIVSVELPSKSGSIAFRKDEEPFSADLEKLKTLRPAFDKQGTITAGNASSINDGAALLLVCDEDTAKAKGWKPLARIVAQASFAHEPKWFTTAPVHGISKVLQKAGLKITDIDLFEINEAFAVVPMAAMRDLKIGHDRVNVFGGAVALGHPIGCSGARIVVTLLNAMQSTKVKRGLATLCIGGGEASAVVIERFD
jgi:acetyl-CoA C-acetyltransferase